MQLKQVTRLSDGISKPSGLRRLSEKNINFARSVGRRLSHMLNLPVGYNMREPNMMHEYIPETEPSPPAKRRDSVTVSLDTVKDLNSPENQQFVSQSNKKSGFRRRFVDNSSQTDLDNRILKPSNLCQSPQSPVNSKSHTFSSITSISIKSGLTKSRDEPVPETNTPVCVSQGPIQESSMSRSSNIENTYDNSVIEYTADDVPKVRKIGHDIDLSSEKYLNNDYAADSDMKASENEFDFEDVKGSPGVYEVDGVIPNQIKFVSTHARERISSTHV